MQVAMASKSGLVGDGKSNIPNDGTGMFSAINSLLFNPKKTQTFAHNQIRRCESRSVARTFQGLVAVKICKSRVMD
jgi:hypothetical protein